jgi:predicted branched-subunit amino acid permease
MRQWAALQKDRRVPKLPAGVTALFPSIWQHPQFKEGARDMFPVAPGIAAWGLMTGVAMMKSGLSLWESLAMALLVFAGSSQLAAMPLLVAGAPMWVIWATGFCVNLRFVVFSLHLRQYLMHQPWWRRLVSGYFTADLSYVAFTKRFPTPAAAGDTVNQRCQDAYLAGGCTTNWGSWVLASLLGVAFGNSIPQAWGLGFAGILALLGICCALADSRMRIVSAAVAGAAAVAAFALPLRLNILLAIGVAVAMCMALESLRPALPSVGKDKT